MYLKYKISLDRNTPDIGCVIRVKSWVNEDISVKSAFGRALFVGRDRQVSSGISG